MRKQSKSVLAVATRHKLSVILEFVGLACHSLFWERSTVVPESGATK
jgi:hypothetical protein